MTDFTKAQMFSSASSNKVFLEGSGAFTIPSFAAPGEAFGLAPIAHGYGSDNLIVQVAIEGVTVGVTVNPTVLPWSSNDNRINLYASIDNTNLYIAGIDSSSGGGTEPARPINYYYRLLIP